MKQRYANKTVLILGATGGLGEGYAYDFHNEGAHLVLAGRDKQKLTALADRLGGAIPVTQADVTSEESLTELATFISEEVGKLDVIINATGYDVRKSLDAHSDEDIHKCLDTNLLGAILVTKHLLPQVHDKRGSTIVHSGGFADGRLAFPYYSVDVAARAGIYSFVESMNREWVQEGKQVRLTYFCPNAADTPAEKPYHEVWKEMGVTISSVEQVSAELLRGVARGQHTIIMGRATRVFAKVNAWSSSLADTLLMKRYGAILRKHFGQVDREAPVNSKRKNGKVLGIGMVALSFLLYALLPIVPFLALSAQAKAIVVGGMMGVSEVIFWIGGLLVGKELIKKYSRKLNPLRWLCCKRTNQET